jgi:hypothetical protein
MLLVVQINNVILTLLGCFDCGMTKLVTCCVVGRGNRYNVRVKDKSFFHYPKVKVSGHPEHVVSKRSRLEWLKRTNLREKDVTKYSRVCSEHFVSGNTVVLKLIHIIMSYL